MDMKTRFGASYFSVIVTIAWPLSHLIILEGIYLLRNLIAPLGDSPAVFVATGIVPYILCIYPARALAMSVMQGRALLNMPILRPGHLIAARWVLEVLNSFVVLFIFVSILYLMDIDIFPLDSITAIEAVFAAIYLGVGLGVLNTALTAIFGVFYVMAFTMFMILLYLTAGTYIPSSSLTEEMREYSTINPLFDIVEWLRSAYYVNYDPAMIGKQYVLEVASVSLLLGLLGERFLRGKYLL
jgi:capsular polysaccharide transport system permease protein